MRAVLFIIGFISVFLVPPAFSFICALALALRWRAWEVIVLGLLVDVLWLPETFFYGIPFVTLCAIALVWLLEPFRRELLLGHAV